MARLLPLPADQPLPRRWTDAARLLTEFQSLAVVVALGLLRERVQQDVRRLVAVEALVGVAEQLVQRRLLTLQ